MSHISPFLLAADIDGTLLGDENGEAMLDLFAASRLEAAELRCEARQTRSMWGIPVDIVVATK